MSTMPMPGQTWLPAAASFLGMWIVMMVAMMLPSLVPTLWRYRQAGLGYLPPLGGVGSFAVGPVFGMVAYRLGLALPRTAPTAVGARQREAEQIGDHPEDGPDGEVAHAHKCGQLAEAGLAVA